MKIFVCFALIALGAASPTKERVSGVTGWYVPQPNGSLEWVTLEEAKQLQNQSRINGRQSASVGFYLYTQNNPNQGQMLTPDNHFVETSNFDPTNPTRFVVHGWQQSYTDSAFQDLKDALLAEGDYNVILVDWAAARNIFYFMSSSAVEETGKTVAQMIDFLRETMRMSFDSLHVIGHSLGAHVSGFAGKNVKSGIVHTIYALDPALPFFSYDSPSTRLADTDAHYVEVIHTCGGKLGFLDPIGSADFYVNGGQDQPGCFMDFLGICAHARSVEYYTEAMNGTPFRSYQCSSYKSATNNQCNTRSSSIIMASPENAYRANGYYYVPVADTAPYAI